MRCCAVHSCTNDGSRQSVNCSNAGCGWQCCPLLGTTFRTVTQLWLALVQHCNILSIESYPSELSSANYCHSYTRPAPLDDGQLTLTAQALLPHPSQTTKFPRFHLQPDLRPQ